MFHAYILLSGPTITCPAGDQTVALNSASVFTGATALTGGAGLDVIYISAPLIPITPLSPHQQTQLTGSFNSPQTHYILAYATDISNTYSAACFFRVQPFTAVQPALNGKYIYIGLQ